MSRRRQLSAEERALWSGFARSITPLPRQRGSPRDASPSAPAFAAGGEASSASTVRAAAKRDARSGAKPPALEPFDRRLRQRIARGREPIDARIDLHGLTQKEAHAALLRFLRRAQADGAKIALVVTGKGGGGREGDAAAGRGVLRRQVPVWLALAEFRSLIVGFEEAHVGHGGQGALYVRLRRGR